MKEFTDYVLPNTATEQGQVDGNYFQHKPYLDDFNKKNGTHIVPVVNVHLEPLGLYSKKIKAIGDIKPGQTIAVPNDTTNEGRALQLLATNNLITLKEGVGTSAKLSDITDKKGLEFKELEAATVPRALNDVDAAIINGNYAIEANLAPAKDALVLEKAEGNPYANFLAVKDGNQNDPRVQKLAKLLNSDEVKKFIEDKYQGSVVPPSAPRRPDARRYFGPARPRRRAGPRAARFRATRPCTTHGRCCMLWPTTRTNGPATRSHCTTAHCTTVAPRSQAWSCA